MITHLVVDPDDARIEVRIASVLCRDGAVTFEGVPDRTALVRLASRVMNVWHHRDSENDGVTVIRDRGVVGRRPSYAGFGNSELMLHTESSAIDQPPQLMMLHCARRAGSGGATRLLDGAALYRALAAWHPELLASLVSPRSVRFGGTAGHLGSVFEQTASRMVVRFRLDDLAQFSPQVNRQMLTLRELIAELATRATLSPGSGYLLCNTRWLHGREAFSGDRLMHRILGNPLRSITIPVGFPATVLSSARHPNRTHEKVASLTNHFGGSP
jgi:alpha-ketoglutarate-dependent taurine dioxygenase